MPAKTKRELPKDVLESDLTPRTAGTYLGYKKVEELGTGGLTFYRTEGFGWVLTTLHISSPSRRQAPGTSARFYGITLAGQIVRVGRGPHVVDEVEVYLTKENLERLQPYVDLWKKGMAEANMIRDGISTRRAAAQIRRNAWGW